MLVSVTTRVGGEKKEQNLGDTDCLQFLLKLNLSLWPCFVKYVRKYLLSLNILFSSKNLFMLL